MTAKLKKLSAAVLACALIFAVKTPALSFETYYNDTKKEYISKGVVYEESRRITDMGLLDVFILRMPAAPDIVLSAALSQEEIGLKETTSKLLADTGAIAGINGDFFGTAGTYSMPLGLTVDTNGVMSVSNDANTGKNKSASFILADDGNYFMNYVNVSVRFLNNGEENIPIGSVNKVADLAWASCLTPDLLSSTAEIDERIKGAVKILVRNDKITYISQKGETVEVPWDGYVIIMSSATADDCISQFSVGDRAELLIDSNINLKSIESAISGGGMILMNGETVTEGSSYATGVHPRSAIGLSQDLKEIILLVADGRSHSVGVAHGELAQLMLEAGAYYAMHLDGGGSSGMAVKKPSAKKPEVVNYPSDGFERKVINALGVYVKAPLEAGYIKSLAVTPYSDTVITRQPVKVDVYGLDEYMRRIDIPQNLITFSSSGKSSFTDGEFTANETGEFELTASYGGYAAKSSVYATEIYELRPSISEIKTSVGGKTKLSYTGVGKNGNLFEIDPSTVKVEVHSFGLGEVEDSVFTSSAIGVGWLKCSVGNVNTYIPIYSTIFSKTIDDLRGNKAMSFSGFPDSVKGEAYYADMPDYYLPVASVYYRFAAADYTQAAYANIQGITGIDALGFKLAVYGDLSGNWLRGRVHDAEGKQYLIDFARVIDWEGWRDVEAWLPEEAVAPVVLDRIYVACLSSERETASQIYFCNLRGLYDHTSLYPEITTPVSDIFKDEMQVTFYDSPGKGYDITFMPDASAPESGVYQKDKALDKFLYNASAGIYIGSNSRGHGFYETFGSVPEQKRSGIVEYEPKFSVIGAGGLYVIQLTASGNGGNSGFMFADKSQWALLKNAIEASYTKNVLIMCDISPRAFSNKKEYELFHSLMCRYVRDGKNIFVLSQGGTEPDVMVLDGVRYITMGSLYDGNDELNESFSVLRFRINGDDIKYSIENVF